MSEHKYWVGYTNTEHKVQEGMRNLVKLWNRWCYCSFLRGQKGRYERKTLSQSALMNRMSVCWRWIWNIYEFLLECAGFIARLMSKAMAVRWSIKEGKVFRISIRKLLKGSRRERKKIKLSNECEMDKYTEELLLSCCFSFTSFMFSLCIVFSLLWTFSMKWLSFTQLLRLVETPIQFLVLPWCGCWMIPPKWALLDTKQL